MMRTGELAEQLMQEAVEEIERNRAELAILRAKMEMIDLFACVLHTQPARRSEGMSVDLVWKLKAKIAEINMENTAPQAASKRAPVPE